MSFGDDTLDPMNQEMFAKDTLYELIKHSYPAFVTVRAKELPTHIEKMLHMAVGISGEAGELIDAVKKSWIYNKPLDVVNCKEELGDLLFYIQGMANYLGVNLQTLIQDNIEKLTKRYPVQYSDKDAQARADKKSSDPIPDHSLDGGWHD